MITMDTHLHTDFSTDSDTPLNKQLKRALAIGLQGICITDHMDYEFPQEAYPHKTDTAPFLFCWEDYVKTIQSYQKTAPLWLGIGVECGLQKNETVISKNQSLVADSNLDYVIGSLHLVDKQDPYYPAFWEEKEPASCVLYYFEQLYENIQAFHSFDAIGHLDYIVRYAPEDFFYQPRDYREILEAILSFLIQKDIALEINTSGFKSVRQSQNPHIDILQQYISLGGELITIGSDAHTPQYVGFHFDDISDILQKIGLPQYCVYKKRKPIFYDC